MNSPLLNTRRAFKKPPEQKNKTKNMLSKKTQKQSFFEHFFTSIALKLRNLTKSIYTRGHIRKQQRGKTAHPADYSLQGLLP
ncbi:MAG: hypothetical protein QXO69_03340, partial [archaeon]